MGGSVNKPHSVLNFNILEQIKEENGSPQKLDENNNSLNNSKRSKKSSLKSHEKSDR